MAPALQERGLRVRHILTDGSLEPTTGRWTASHGAPASSRHPRSLRQSCADRAAPWSAGVLAGLRRTAVSCRPRRRADRPWAGRPTDDAHLRRGPARTPALHGGWPVRTPALPVWGPVRTPALPVWGPARMPALPVWGPARTPALPVQGPVGTPAVPVQGPARTPALPVQGPARTPALPVQGPARTPALPVQGPARAPALPVQGPARTPALPVEGPVGTPAVRAYGVMIAFVTRSAFTSASAWFASSRR